MFSSGATSESSKVDSTGLNPYFGDLHTHTAYSDAWEGTPWDAFAAAKAAGADFMATTDHDYYLSAEEWADTLQAAEHFTSDTFVAMAAYEFWIAGAGEMNVYNTPDFPPEPTDPAKRKVPGPRGPPADAIQGFYDWLAQQSGAVAQWNHPTYVTRNFFNFAYQDPVRDQGMGIIEVWNWKYTEPSYVLALDKGWHVMPSANSDTHSPDWISGSEVRTVLLAPSLTPENLYEAMAEQRGYATLDKNLQVYYTLNGDIMGSTLSGLASTYTAWVHVEDPDGVPEDDITLVEIISDGGEVVASVPTSGTVVDLSITLTSETSSYYYVRVTTESNMDGDPGVTAWTAPVWTGR